MTFWPGSRLGELSQHLRDVIYDAASDPSVLDTIERNADRILSETGIRLDCPDTVERLRAIGADARDGRVFLDGAALREVVRRSAPSTFRVRGRSPARDIDIGAHGVSHFAPIYGAPDVLLDTGERVKGNLALYRELVCLAHASPGITNTGHMICVIDDVAEERRPWAMMHAHLTCSDKPFMGCIAPARFSRDFIAAAREAIGRPAEPGACNLVHLVNCTPPLTYWKVPLACLREIAEAGEAAMISSYMMMGATSPVTIGGALAQGYAEVLAGMAIAQLWNPGTPVIMGILAWPFDMRSMLPNFGDPASRLVQYHAAALARRLGVPCRGDGAVTSSKIDDAQAGSEGAGNLFAAVNSGASFVLHSAGWLEQGRCVSIAKLRRDGAAIGADCFGTTAQCGPPAELDPAVEREIRARAFPA